MSSIKHKAVSGVKWQVTNKVSQKVISVITFAVLARILEPKSFGLFAMAFIMIDALHFFKSFGIDTALVQRKKDVERANNTAFIIILVSSATIFTVCYVAAPFASHFFKNPQVLPIIRALGFVFIFHCFSKVPNTILTKQMQFRLTSIIELIGTVANSAFAILFAFLGWDVWSLVTAYLIKQTILAVLGWYYSGFRFRWEFDPKIAKELLGYGRFMIGLSVFWFISDQANNIVVARILGATLLGYFALATNIGNLISTHFTELISSVMFPAYAALQDDREALKKAYLKTVKFVSMCSIPFSVGLICLADELILTVYGVKWAAVIPLVRLYGCVQLVAPIIACSGPVYLGCGKPTYSFWLTFSSLVIRIPLLVILTKTMGLPGAVIPVLIAMVIMTPFHIRLVQRFTHFTYREFFGQLVPSIICSAVMFVAILFLKGVWSIESIPAIFNHHFVQLLFFSGAGVGAYVLSIFLMDRGSTLEIKRLLLHPDRV